MSTLKSVQVQPEVGDSWHKWNVGGQSQALTHLLLTAHPYTSLGTSESAQKSEAGGTEALNVPPAKRQALE